MVSIATRNRNVISVDGMLWREDLVILTNVSQLMAAKVDEPNLHV